jgi:general secretion pathway protein K
MSRPVDRRGERGIVLMLVLWVFMTLGVLALDFSQYMRDDAMAALNLSDETAGYYLAVGGMNTALYRAMRVREQGGNGATQRQVNGAHQVNQGGQPGDTGDDEDQLADLYPVNGHWVNGTLSSGDGQFAVRLTGEDGRIPLNAELTPESRLVFSDLIRYVVTNLVRGGNQTTGVDREADEHIRQIVDSIIDWRDCDSDALPNGAEDEYYLSLARPHRAKNDFFDSPEELLQVRGVTPEIFYGHDGQPGLGEIFSPFPKGEEIHINVKQITTPVLRALLPNKTDDEMADLMEQRDEDPEGMKLVIASEIEAAIPGISDQVLTSEEPKYIRVEARADVRAERNRAAVAAIVELGDNEGPQVLRWLDRAPLDSDEPGVSNAAPAEGPTS